jgi:CheY-like chemotaxis protein
MNSITENTALEGLKVLIAEDNPLNMMIASKCLEKWKIIHSKAANGLEAVSLCSEQTFDLILMDLEMPEMNGYEAVAAIRKFNISIPILAFTASVFENMDEQLAARGFTGYVQKPFKQEELHATLVRLRNTLP